MTRGIEDWKIPRSFYNDEPSKRWTQCPKPMKDEAFSSWFTRLLKLNCADVMPIIQAFLKKRSSFMEIEGKDEVKSSLIKRLEPYIDISKLRFNKHHVGIILDENIHGTMALLDNYMISPKYCPLCLKDDKTPYFRYFWHLPFITMCSTHHSLLFNQCPSCHHLINYWETGWNDSIATCFSCHDDLRNNFDFIYTISNPDKMFFQNDLLEIYEKGTLHGNIINQSIFFNQLYEFVKNERPFISKVELTTNCVMELIFQSFQNAFRKIIEVPGSETTQQNPSENNNVKTRAIKENSSSSTRIKESNQSIAEYRYRIIKPFLNSTYKTTEEAKAWADDAGIKLSTFYNWVSHYRRGGLAALSPRNGSSKQKRVDIILSEAQDTIEESHSLPYQNCFSCPNKPPRAENSACQKCLKEHV